MSSNDKASQQLQQHASAQGNAQANALCKAISWLGHPCYLNEGQNSDVLTSSGGAPIESLTNLLTIGPRGPALFQNTTYLDNQAHFNRERIPERVAHAKGAGAFGYLEITNDITKYCKAKIFEKVGKRTPVAARFSTVAGEKGSADTDRDAHGFALKFYTEEGNWDLVGITSPIFLVRDAILFPSLIHAVKRNPATHLKDPNMYWDFMTLNRQTTHAIMMIYTDRGTPDGYRHTNGYGAHTFKMLDAHNNPIYCKFHFKTNQGVQNLTAQRAKELTGMDPDYAVRDLYNAIAEGQYPSWNMFIQVMTLEQAKTFKFNPFDVTKIWPHAEYPLIPVGRMTLNRNPANYFAEVEQIGFSPASLVPGIAPSPDKVLQGRLFAYSDTQRHRLGANSTQIPVNCPYNAMVNNYQRDGPMNVTTNDGGDPNYYPNSFNGPTVDVKRASTDVFYVAGDVNYYKAENEDNFTQAGDFWRNVLSAQEKDTLVENLTSSLKLTQSFIQERAIQNFTMVDGEFGSLLRRALMAAASDVKMPPPAYHP